jgi:hypothetical protein
MNSNKTAHMQDAKFYFYPSHPHKFTAEQQKRCIIKFLQIILGISLLAPYGRRASAKKTGVFAGKMFSGLYAAGWMRSGNHIGSVHKHHLSSQHQPRRFRNGESPRDVRFR